MYIYIYAHRLFPSLSRLNNAQVDGIIFLVDAADRTRFQAWVEHQSPGSRGFSSPLRDGLK